MGLTVKSLFSQLVSAVAVFKGIYSHLRTTWQLQSKLNKEAIFNLSV